MNLKKIILKISFFAVSFLCICLTFLLTGCNKQILDTTYEFDKVYFIESGVELKIKKWNDYDGEQLQLVLEDGTVLLVNSSKVYLIGKGDLPEELKATKTIYIMTEEDYKEAIKEI